MLSIRVSTRLAAVPTFSITIGRMSPAAYLTSASAKLPSLKARPIASFASRMLRSRLRSLRAREARSGGGRGGMVEVESAEGCQRERLQTPAPGKKCQYHDSNNEAETLAIAAF
eukprot:1073604-Pleurochrysis_carterae.AAC.2